MHFDYLGELPKKKKRKENNVTLDSCPASLAGLSPHHEANCSSVIPYFFPYDHVTGRTNCTHIYPNC